MYHNNYYLLYIQWQLLSRDEGEVDTGHDPSWIEDEGTYNCTQWSMVLYIVYIARLHGAHMLLE